MTHRRTVRIGTLATVGAVAGIMGIGGGLGVAAIPPDTAPAVSTTLGDPATIPDPTAPPTIPSTVPPAPAPAVPSTTTLPLFGVQLTIDISAGPGGTLANIAVNPAVGLTATELRPNEVVFVNTAGTTELVVKSRGGGQRVEATSRSIDDFLAGGGAGGWSGDIFGTGEVTTVGFTVTKSPDGSPGITGVTTSDPTAVIGAVEHEADDGEIEAKVRIAFSRDGQSRNLSIKVEVEGDEASVRVTLSRLRGAQRPVSEATGPGVWNGTLCDGSVARIDYVLTAEGELADVVATPEADRVRVRGNGAEVRFSGDERVKLKVRRGEGPAGEATLAVGAEARFRCDVPDPTVNVPVDTSVPDGDDDDDEGDDDSDRRNRGGRDDDDRDDDDRDDDDRDDDDRDDDGDRRNRGGRDGADDDDDRRNGDAGGGDGSGANERPGDRGRNAPAGDSETDDRDALDDGSDG